MLADTQKKTIPTKSIVNFGLTTENTLILSVQSEMKKCKISSPRDLKSLDPLLLVHSIMSQSVLSATLHS